MREFEKRNISVNLFNFILQTLFFTTELVKIKPKKYKMKFILYLFYNEGNSKWNRTLNL